MVKSTAEKEKEDLDSLIERTLDKATESATAKAVDTLHPKDKVHNDRLTVLNGDEVAGHSIMEWTSLLLGHITDKSSDKGFIMDGFSEKLKALKVSKEGVGRAEISTIFKPEVIGAMLQQGMIPMGDNGQLTNKVNKPGLGRKLF